MATRKGRVEPVAKRAALIASKRAQIPNSEQNPRASFARRRYQRIRSQREGANHGK